MSYKTRKKKKKKKTLSFYFFGPDNGNAKHQNIQISQRADFIFLTAVIFTAFIFITVMLPRLKVVMIHDFEKVASAGR